MTQTQTDWQKVSEGDVKGPVIGHLRSVTEKLPVPGGALYRTIVLTDKGEASVAAAFVPDSTR